MSNKIPSVKDFLRTSYDVLETNKKNEPFEKVLKDIKQDPEFKKFYELMSIWRKQIISAVKEQHGKKKK